jgi:hypothetical protein
MHTTLSLIDEVIALHHLRSDYALAKFLNVTPMTVTRWRGGGHMSDEMAVKVAHVLSLPPAYVLACMGAQRAEAGTESSGTWRQIADAFRDKVALALLITALGFTGFPSDSLGTAAPSPVRNNVYYGKSRKRPPAGRGNVQRVSA